ncbi:hypothetical protein PanWU01x14_123300 [Parasponia andersonii]|uniref:Uncharacterized protein n=1 Tax=Parasponia andersonii TaxID=3476 RepID=A0A2P5CU87_PARAD|nr:hypothetical protein PanWU01x14_123300 [Parasponia andersonii]
MFERLAIIFGKDRATGRGAETPADVVENMNQKVGEDDDETRSVNQTFSMPATRRKRSRSENIHDGMIEIASSFKTMFEQSFEQVRLISERLVQGNEDGKDIAWELKQMGLLDDDQLDANSHIGKITVCSNVKVDR